MSAERKTIQHFLDQREEYVRVLRQCVEANDDYYRWQGHAEARRQLRTSLENAGVDLTVEPVAVASRGHIAADVLGPAICKPDWSLLDLADALLADGVFQREIDVKRAVAEAIVTAAKDHAIDGQVRLTELIHIANEAVGR